MFDPTGKIAIGLDLRDGVDVAAALDAAEAESVPPSVLVSALGSICEKPACVIGQSVSIGGGQMNGDQGA